MSYFNKLSFVFLLFTMLSCSTSTAPKKYNILSNYIVQDLKKSIPPDLDLLFVLKPESGCKSCFLLLAERLAKEPVYKNSRVIVVGNDHLKNANLNIAIKKYGENVWFDLYSAVESYDLELYNTSVIFLKENDVTHVLEYSTSYIPEIDSLLLSAP